MIRRRTWSSKVQKTVLRKKGSTLLPPPLGKRGLLANCPVEGVLAFLEVSSSDNQGAKGTGQQGRRKQILATENPLCISF